MAQRQKAATQRRKPGPKPGFKKPPQEQHAPCCATCRFGVRRITTGPDMSAGMIDCRLYPAAQGPFPANWWCGQFQERSS